MSQPQSPWMVDVSSKFTAKQETGGIRLLGPPSLHHKSHGTQPHARPCAYQCLCAFTQGLAGQSRASCIALCPFWPAQSTKAQFEFSLFPEAFLCHFGQNTIS